MSSGNYGLRCAPLEESISELIFDSWFFGKEEVRGSEAYTPITIPIQLKLIKNFI